ncbi:MAG: amidohydrolase family protein [Ignavibacteria bacterium]|jgi:hypothetical protein
MSMIMEELSFFDCNAFIGKHQNPYTKEFFGADMLCEKIRTSGLQKSLIYHSASVLYDAAYGNQLLTDETNNKADLYLVWIAVPEFFCKEEETKVFFEKVKKNNISAIKIYPRYHDFIINNGALDKMFSALQSENIPLLVAQEEISWDELNYIFEKFPGLPLVLQNIGYRLERIVAPYLNKYDNFYMDISRYQVHGGIEYLCYIYGSEHLLFGSGMPIFSAEAIMMMIDKADISLSEKQNISSNNLLRLLKNG